jgi:hypothetical protein
MRAIAYREFGPLSTGDSMADQIISWLTQGEWLASRAAVSRRPASPGALPSFEYRRNPASKIPFLVERKRNEEITTSVREQAKATRGARVRQEVLEARTAFGVTAPGQVAGVGAGES